jgi:hypothetical protein
MARQRLSVFSQICAAIGTTDDSLIAMLEAYFDESGNDDRSNIFTVAGFIATRSQWEAFEAEWKELLADEKIERFHRVDLEWFRGDFHRDYGWDEARRNRVVREAQETYRSACFVRRKEFDNQERLRRGCACGRGREY